MENWWLCIICCYNRPAVTVRCFLSDSLFSTLLKAVVQISFCFFCKKYRGQTMIVTNIHGRYRHHESWVVIMIICCWSSVSLVVCLTQFKFSKKKRNETNLHSVSTAWNSYISLDLFNLSLNGPIPLSNTSVPFNYYMILIGIENMSVRQCLLSVSW